MKTLKTIARKPETKIGIILFVFTILLAFTFIEDFKNTFDHIVIFLTFTLPFLTLSITFIILSIKETINGNK